MDRKTVLVTGATSGIGRQTALHLARLGHRVFATGRREEALESLRREGDGLPLETVRLDVNDPASIESARAEVEKRTGGYGVDVLVNNAGYGPMAPVALITSEDMRGQFETNVFGLVRVTQAFLPAMRARGSGKIVNVSSLVGRLSFAFQGLYSASKYAVEALTDCLRREVAGFGIRVVLVEPGVIRSQFESTAGATIAKYRAMDAYYGAALERYRKTVGLFYKTAPTPERVARTIARIVEKGRPRARYVTPAYNIVAVWFHGLLPASWWDAIVRLVAGLGRVRPGAKPSPS